MAQGAAGHHSLVTPIDWKPLHQSSDSAFCICHLSLVTPIDWKLCAPNVRPDPSKRPRSPLAGDTY